jgi:hypothetical protein
MRTHDHMLRPAWLRDWRRRRSRLLPLLALAVLSCGGQTDDLGLHAWLRVPGAEYVSGPLPQPSNGPVVQQASVSRSDVIPGQGDRSVDASFDLSANGVTIGIDGDTGYWVLPVGPPEVQQPGSLSIDADLFFASFLPPGNFNLIVRPVSADGEAGAGATIPLRNAQTALPPGSLAFTLSWDTEADLDLHVVDPSGEEIYWDHIASASGGLLDFDSNESCVIDGRRRERVFWNGAAPSGHYVVRVDTAALCGQPDAHWQLEADLDESVAKQASGESIPADTRYGHARGAGLTALELDVP